ncbi:MAG: hypothetical protein CVU56_01245 [Deltaproteobacteria bacterium HGW-Deltaproteobacteria-14]|jgi:TolB-like protein|nr:MAG: hypothetical protein CVU56_01245 [Deltaproteobacteria bacterium HGW-Deltaproteobacteria-14]
MRDALARLAVAALTLALASTAVAAAPRTVAVLPWIPGAAPQSLGGFGTALAGMVVTDLASVPGLQLVERERLNAVLDELSLSRTAFVDPVAAVRVGHGLGAELLVSGSFSVVAERLLMDARLIAVESGNILAAVRSEGPLEEYVAVEKDVVEQLLGQLKISLTPGARRTLLVRAQTEDPTAFAKFGAGLEARDAGDVASATRAFEAALAVDPGFADAATALAGLAAKAEALSSREATRSKDARHKSLDDALAQLVDETTRPAGFTHTQDSVRDFAIRMALLRASRQHCRRYAELEAFLAHTAGGWPEILESGDPNDHRVAWQATSRILDARGAALGVSGASETWYGRRPGELMQAAYGGMSSPQSLLLYRHLSPEKFDASLAAALANCYPREARPARWAPWIERVKAWGLSGEPLWVQYGQGPVTISVGDAMTLHLAFLEADASGVTPAVNARVEAVLARHPEGDRNRREVLSRVRDITAAAEARERRVASRLGRDAAAVLRDGSALATTDAAALHLDDPLCAELVAREAPQAGRAWTRWLEMKDSTNAGFRDDRLDQVADALAVVRMAGCFRDSPKRPALDTLFADVRRGLERRHPATLEDSKCRSDAAELGESVRAADAIAVARLEPKRAAGRVEAALSRLHRLRVRRCLVP